MAVRRSIKGQQTVEKALILMALVGGSIFVLMPIMWMFSTALKPPGAVFEYPIRWIPRSFVWKNFAEAVTVIPFWQFTKNTVLVTGLAMLGQVFSSALVAYGFARFRFPGRNVLFLILLSTLMIPYPVRLIPVFILFRLFGWVNTYKPLIVPFFFGGTPFFIFLLRQFFMTLPTDIDDAAKIDGCNSFQIFWRILLPMAKPGLVSVGMFSFMNNWNDFMRPLIYLNDMEKYTLSLGLRLFKDLHTTDWNLMMAAALLVMLPCIVIFFIGQKHFIQGVVVSGVKG